MIFCVGAAVVSAAAALTPGGPDSLRNRRRSTASATLLPAGRRIFPAAIFLPSFLPLIAALPLGDFGRGGSNGRVLVPGAATFVARLPVSG